MATLALHAGGIRLTVITNTKGEPTFTSNPGGIHTGPGSEPDNHLIKIRNTTAIRLRVCVKSNDGDPVEADFDTPLNVTAPGDFIGWIEVPARGPGAHRDTLLQLSDNAFATPNQYTFSVARSTTSVCTFDTADIGSTQDIIIP